MGEPRVLHLTEVLEAGVLTMLVRLSARQIEAGASVDVAYSARPETLPPETLRARFDSRVGVRLLPSRPGILRRSLAMFRATRAALASGTYDVIHLHSSFAGFAGRLAAMGSRSSTVVLYSPHGFAFLRRDASLAVRLVWQLVEGLMARVGVCVLLCESELATARSRLHPRRAMLLRNGVPVADYASFQSHGSSDPPVVSMIGRISYQKAPWRFATVARALGDRARFVWIGDGRPADRERWLGDSGVEVTGWLDEELVRKLLVDTSVLLFPTLWEGMSMALMQAQAQGVPAVVSDAVGNRDAVLQGRTGYVTATDDELVARTAELLEDAALRQRMSRAAVTWAQLGLSDETLGTDSLDLYREALAERAGSR